MSSVSLWEYVNLVGHYNKLLYRETIDPRLLARGYTEDQIKQMQQHRKAKNMEIVSCSLHLVGDLERWDHPYFSYLMTLYDQYHKNGVLPFPGALTKQPAKILELFDVLEQLSMERDDKIRREQEQQARKNQRKKR